MPTCAAVARSSSPLAGRRAVQLASMLAAKRIRLSRHPADWIAPILAWVQHMGQFDRSECLSCHCQLLASLNTAAASRALRVAISLGA